MALATTTLSSAVSITDNSIVLASATSIAVGRLILIDQEIMQVAQSWVSGTTVPVLRGREGSTTAAHKTTANVTHGAATDFSNASPTTEIVYQPQRATLIQSITATSTLTLPAGGTDLRLILNGTSVIALTVPVPTKDMDMCKLTIVGNGVAAHTVTFTGGLSGAGSSYDVFTTNSSAPVCIEAYACNGVWVTPTTPAWTGTVTNLVGGIA